MRNLQATNKYNADDSDETYCFISGKKNISKIYIMLNFNEKESQNHYVPLKSKTNKNELSKEIRDEIKISMGIIKDKSKEKVKNIITGKIRGSRIGISEWKPLYINNNNNLKGVDNKKYYTIEKDKINKYLDKNKVELKFDNSIKLSEIFNEFKNVNNISIDIFKQKYRNIIIDDIIINNETHKVDSAFFKKFK